MPTRATEPAVRSGDPTPDQNFAAAFTIYAGVVSMGYGLVVALLAGVRSPAVLFATASVTVLVGGLCGGAAIGQWEFRPHRVGRSRLRYGFVLPGAVLVGGGIGNWLFGVDAVGVASLFLGFAGFSFGGLLAMMARTRYVRALVGDRESLVSFRAETAPAAKRRRYILIGVLFAAMPVAFAVGFIVQSGYTSYLPGFGGLIGALLGSGIRSETMHVHSEGIEIERPVNRQFIAWSRLGGFKQTGAELRLERPLAPDYRLDRSQIEDIDTVIELLRANLDS